MAESETFFCVFSQLSLLTLLSSSIPPFLTSCESKDLSAIEPLRDLEATDRAPESFYAPLFESPLLILEA
eukprot:CAMPEP_0185619606 /NCGR_PEP_ID=MMETSP0436-20130131/51133_1 /TAXON_ID=626734 ORGANISM="Favella taraikaensis, Strain Fe Narragansett Bay" /NCGR_SAMPLE_ID=MMETSP0436 /ASSEMBLY_ACC=CAM_ASM_000390 /LENGTH=69 /DNA_ID=CAMNT_0028259223 /DNA_START=1080 /DNA_END=1289 /DNA_ORIENTATION=+